MSSVVDEDTARAVQSGRETVGSMISSAQGDLQKIFVVFLVGFLGTFYTLRIWIWDFLRATAKAEMNDTLAGATDLITRTPFEVILLQAKIGLLFGVIVAIPAFVYFSRDAIRRRGYQSAVPVSKWFVAAFVAASLSLFSIGVVYAYGVFFPFTFQFLGSIAYSAGVKPSWGITEFTEFVALLTISFGLAAQLPLFMGVFSYTEIVPYETFRDKWRHAIVAISVFGALFSPPDPFTLIMWAAPLVLLYGFSLGLAKLIANTRRRGAAEVGSGVEHVKRRLLQFVAVVIATMLVVVGALYAGIRELIATEVIPRLPSALTPTEPTYFDRLVIEHGELGMIAVGLLVALGVGVLILGVLTIQVLRTPIYPRETQLMTAETAADVDFDVLDVEDVERVPAPVFASMSEDAMMDVARDAMLEDDREKAQAIIDRYDAIDSGEAGAEGAGAAAAGGAADAAGADESESVFASTAAGVLDPFTEEETTEEDIGGYAYDLAFIVDSLTSRLIYIVGLFMAVLVGVFGWLYVGGIGDALVTFVDQVPESVITEMASQQGVDPSNFDTTTALLQELGFVIALHPVEVLIFIVKVSTLAAIVAVLPLVLYFAWPAAKERGLARGDRRLFLVWGGSLALGFAGGLAVGFYYIAPAVISYLITDAVANGMVISYRIKSLFWLVIYTTVGVGFLVNLVVTMALFHVGNIVSYRTMLRFWKPIVVSIWFLSALFSPRGLITMLAFAIPLSLTYVLGLALLYVLTAGGRLFGGGGGPTADEPAAEPADASE
ncbi:twin-arginine translocase subunit TatC [Halovivax limisalsi]|uniref:twin-arginine translocase subunit TatC n=1 Tax=Halovivax limisalsi TaxID=1453760 RepID=UPI001FFCD622|nr:twin-arginine translocase subunit TatC [Halovivax limisalsi]